jgi:hypothetical protein
MNREQVQAEYLDLLNKKLDEEEKIIEDAKKRGIWKDGLDTNRELFKDLDVEFSRKIMELKTKSQGEGA